MGKRHIVFTSKKDSTGNVSGHFTDEFVQTGLTVDHFVSLAEAIRGMVCCWLPDTTLTFVNQNYADHFHMHPQKLLGQKWNTIIPINEQKKIERLHKTILHIPKIHIHEHSYINATNETRHIEWTDYPIIDDKNGKIIEFLSIGRDITEQKQKEEALKDSENRNAQIVESMQEGLIMQDHCGVVTYVNDSFLRIFPVIKKKDLIGKTVYELSKLHVSISNMLITQSQRHDNAQRKIQEVVLEGNGPVTHIHVSSVPIFDQFKKYKGGFAIIVDISQQKRNEQRLQKINDCLLMLGQDSSKNIQYLTRLFGEVMGATCALYNHLEENMLFSYGQWQTPEDYVERDEAEGHICYDVIKHGAEQPYVVRNLQSTSYYHTDPNVARYGLRTYIGQAVRSGALCVGSLCVVYQHDYEPTQDDLKIMGIIASAISGEIERQAAQKLLKNKMQMQKTISVISSRFVGDVDFDHAIRLSLADMGDLSGASRAFLFLIRDDKYISITHDWCAPGITSQADRLKKLSVSSFPWWMKKMKDGEMVNIRDIESLKEVARAEYDLLKRIGTRSLLSFPIFANGRAIGFMGYDCITSSMKWQEEDYAFLRICAEIFGSAIDIRHALEKIRITKREWEITVDALPQVICLLDQNERIVRINRPIEEWGVSNLQDAQGRRIHDIFHPGCNEKRCEFLLDIKALWHKIQEGHEGEFIYKSEDINKTICIKMYPHMGRQSGEMSYAAIAVVYDITEKVRANQKIFDMFKYLGLINRKVSILLNMRKGEQLSDVDNVYTHIVQSSLQIADARISLLYEYRDDVKKLHLLAGGGLLSQTDKKRLRVINGDAYIFLRKMMRNKRRVQGVFDDESFRDFVIDHKFKKTIHTCLAVPILCQDVLKGVLILGFSKDHDLTTQELEFYELFSLQTCLIIMNLKQ